jgi:peptide/nickel transport system substrate-binding protein
VPNSPSPFTSVVRDITEVEKLSPTLLRFHTKVPVPTLPRKMTNLYIIPSELESASTQDFNDGKAAIGTGPFTLVKWSPGQSLELKRFDGYWGDKPEWESVTEVVLPNDGARSAALLAGDVQVISYVPFEDFQTFKASDKYDVFSGPLARLHYVAMDSERDDSPFAKGPKGENPLKDMRVRKALSLAIDRQAIVDKLQQGVGEPAGQVLPPSMKGGPGIAAPAQDIAAARALLAEAGYGDGFKLTLHATNDRYPGDVEIAQALAQMWTRIGVDASVETLAQTIFFPKASDFEFSIFSAQYADDTNQVMSRSMLHSRDRDRGLGSGNRGRYSNKEVDARIEAASQEFDQDKADALTVEAIRMALEEQALIPVFFPGFTVATTADLTAEPRLDGRFNATMVHSR